VCVCVYVCVLVRACVCVLVRACVCVSVCVCLCMLMCVRVSVGTQCMMLVCLCAGVSYDDYNGRGVCDVGV
jgi:hypothetical protein